MLWNIKIERAKNSKIVQLGDVKGARIVKLKTFTIVNFRIVKISDIFEYKNLVEISHGEDIHRSTSVYMDRVPSGFWFNCTFGIVLILTSYNNRIFVIWKNDFRRKLTRNNCRFFELDRAGYDYWTWAIKYELKISHIRFMILMYYNKNGIYFKCCGRDYHHWSKISFHLTN